MKNTSVVVLVEFLIFILAVLIGQVVLAQTGQVQLSVRALHFNRNDTLSLYIWNDAIHADYVFNTPYRVVKKVKEKTGDFIFQLDSITTFSWISLAKDKERVKGMIANPLLSLYPICPGDSVTINVEPRQELGKELLISDNGDSIFLNDQYLKFSGEGYEKYEMKWKIEEFLRSGLPKMTEGEHQLGKEGLMKRFNRQYEDILAIMDEYKAALDTKVFDLEKADYMANIECEKMRIIDLDIFAWRRLNVNMDAFQNSSKLYRNMIMETKGQDLPETIRAQSPNYIKYLVKKSRLDQMVVWGIPSNGLMYDIVNEIASANDQGIQDRLRTALILEDTPRFSLEERESVVNDAIKKVRNKFCLQVLKNLNMLAPGKKVMDISLPDEKGNKISLRDFKGKIVLLDFYYASCAPCIGYLKEVVRPTLATYKNDSRVVFISVSIDRKETFLRTLKNKNFMVDGSIHLYTENKGSQHPLIEYYQINSYPTPIVYDGEGKIIAAGKDIRTKEGLKEVLNKALTEL